MGALIRGLTIKQPWAWAIAVGNKPCENRTWAPPEKMLGGYLAIHAGQELDPEARAWMAKVCGVGAPPDEELRRGAIIAVARLARVTTWGNDAAALRESSRWAQGPKCWWLEDVLAVEPIPCRGQQGLWELDPEIHQALRVEWYAAREAHKARLARPGPRSQRLAHGPLPRTRCPCGVESRWCGVCGRCQADGHELCEHTRAARAA